MKVCELFAGVGGFRLGLESSSPQYQFVWANQWEPSRKSQDAFDCYTQHFGESENHVNKDINTISKNKIPNHDLLVGGFPCQDYSVARTQAKGITGMKGVLWWEIYETLKEKNPKFVLLENVDRLLKSPTTQRGRDFGIMLACFNELNYSVEWRVINAAEYGFPQKRRRVFIFAFKNSTKYAKKIPSFELEKYLHKEGFFQEKFPIKNSSQVDKPRPNWTTLKYKDLVELSNEFEFKFENAGFMNKGKIYTENTKPNYKGKNKHLKDLLETNVDEKYYLTKESLGKFKKAKGSKKIERKSKEGHCYTFSEGNLPFPDKLDSPARTMLTSEATVNRSSHVIEDPETKKIRTITPLEAERINGFKDNWTNTGMSERFRYFCMGNALVVGLINKMGKALIKIYNNEEN